jgi:hypothetical protein
MNSAHLIANWLTGRQIVEFEQGPVERAAYGHEVLKGLSGALMSDFGKGFSISALKYMRAFYTGYPGLLPIGHAMRDQLALPDSPQIGHAARDLFVRPSVEAGTDMASGRNSSRSVLEALSNLTQGRAPRRARFLRDRKHQARLAGTKRHSSPACGTSYANLVAALPLSAGRCASPWTGDHFYPDLVFYHLCVPSAKRN